MKTQTNSRKYEGQCKFCQDDFTKRQIAEHLDVCPQRTKDAAIKNLRLRIADPYMKNFWLIVEVGEQAKFSSLDKLIRDVWVECCGHLSEFGGYGGVIGKAREIMTTLRPGDSINYTYDFGSSTELTIGALEYSHCQLSAKQKIELVGRNYLPMSDCAKCGQQATGVCVACCENGPVSICDQCAEQYHNEDSGNGDEEHYVLAIANSPRSGVCGYGPPGQLDRLF